MISNNASKTYEEPVITDVLDNNLVQFVDGSVTIDGVSATEQEYSLILLMGI